jgi:hypothetical protein
MSPMLPILIAGTSWAYCVMGLRPFSNATESVLLCLLLHQWSELLLVSAAFASQLLVFRYLNQRRRTLERESMDTRPPCYIVLWVDRLSYLAFSIGSRSWHLLFPSRFRCLFTSSNIPEKIRSSRSCLCVLQFGQQHVPRACAC